MCARIANIANQNLGRFPQELIDSLLDALADETTDAEPRGITIREEHSNDLAEIHFSDGRTLMIKRARAPWAGPRFNASRRAARWLREQAGIVAPEHLPVTQYATRLACHAYWRIPLPTLKEVWPQIPAAEKAGVLRSWGELIGRIHELQLPGFGPLQRASRTPFPLATFLEQDLARRLLPTVVDVWPAAVTPLEYLIQRIPAAAARARDQAVVVHNDMHMENVLCEVAGESVRCVGVLDLEAAFGGPPETDLAVADVLHGPLFAQPLGPGWLDALLQGYDRALDPYVLAFFRAYHLLNVGFYAALMGQEEHARDVARAALRETECLRMSPMAT